MNTHKITAFLASDDKSQLQQDVLYAEICDALEEGDIRMEGTDLSYLAATLPAYAQERGLCVRCGDGVITGFRTTKQVASFLMDPTIAGLSDKLRTGSGASASDWISAISGIFSKVTSPTATQE